MTVIEELVDLIEYGVGSHEGSKGRYVSGLKLGATKRKKRTARERVKFTATIAPGPTLNAYPENFIKRFKPVEG